MILHLACFDFVERTTEEDVAGLTAALEEMAASLPVVRFYRCGANLRLRPGADFGVVAVLDDPSGLEAYLGSDAHAVVQDTWISWMVAERHAVQLDLGESALAAALAS